VFPIDRKFLEAVEQERLEDALDSDPSLEQIKVLTAEIREGWSERTRHNRIVAKHVRSVTSPVSIAEWVASIESALVS